MTRVRRLKVIVEADGAARGNPGPAGYGVVIREASTGEVLLEEAQALGVATNNVAEYTGLVAGLRAAANLGAVEVEARLDSRLVVEQMSGRWQIKNPDLRTLAAQAAALVNRFDTVRFVWVPRERNARADALANAAIDGQTVPEPDLGRPTSWTPRTAGATRLVLVRHGETELTAKRRYSGRRDVPLTERGLMQAAATATRVAAIADGAAVVATSPLSRCRRTAEEIARALGGPPVVDVAGLVECDFGEWEGLTFAEVRERWPQQLDEWLGSTAVAPPGGESFADVATRVSDAVSRLLREHSGRTVVVVSHVTPIKLILRDALAATDAFLHRLFLDPGGISIVDWWPDGGIAVRTVNDTAHLMSR